MPAEANERKAGKEQHSYSTDSWSTSFPDREEKLGFLEEYLVLPSEVRDAEYHIVYQDNSGGLVPGPSDWDIRAALRVEQEDMALWTEGMNRILPEQIDLGLWNGLETEALDWGQLVPDGCYKRPDSRSYVVLFKDSGIILKLVSTLYLAPALDGSNLKDEIPGYEEHKTLVADTLGYDHSAVPYIRTVQADKIKNAEGVETEIVCYSALFHNSPLYGIPVLVVRTEDQAVCTVLFQGSYQDRFSLADIDGDGNEEILIQSLVSITGGAGGFETAIYKLDHGRPELLFCYPGQEEGERLDTGFALTFADGDKFQIRNGLTDYCTEFSRGPSAADDSYPYFDEQESFWDLGVDPFFYLFEPVDCDGDGADEILTAQYTYFHSRADGLGTAYSIIKWNQDKQMPEIVKSGFWPYEDCDEDSRYDYDERWSWYEANWYKE